MEQLNITIPIIAVIVLVFWVFKAFVLPLLENKLDGDTINKLINAIPLIKEKAKELVLWAKNNYPDNSGIQKMAACVTKISDWLTANGLTMDKEEIEGIVQEQYNLLKQEVNKDDDGE